MSLFGWFLMIVFVEVLVSQGSVQLLQHIHWDARPGGCFPT